MSISRSFSGAKSNSLSGGTTAALATRMGWKTAIPALIFQLALSNPAMASSIDVDRHDDNSCRTFINPVASKSEAILGRTMSALEAIQANQRVDAGPACRGASVISSDPVVIVSNQLPLAAFGPFARSHNAVKTSAITTNPPLLAQALAIRTSPAALEQAPAILTEEQFRQQSAPFARFAFANFRLPMNPVHFPPRETTPGEPNARIASAEISDGNGLPAPNALKEPKSERAVITPFNGKPDIFGTVALRVSHTPLDRKWTGAQNSRERTMARAALVRAGGTVDASHQETNIRAVNRWINANIKYVEDRKLYGQADHWASAGATLRSGRGDCEDFAIAKMQLLQASGVKASDMFLVIAKDLVRRADHSLLVIRVGNRMLVLDNETDQILNAEDVRDYRPIMSYSANGKWLHGYPAKPSGTQIASLAVGR
tara:strand:+ start:21822 stop:23108 length:1287 start_codon:yes stop_codon:yes gene_type:complete